MSDFTREINKFKGKYQFLYAEKTPQGEVIPMNPHLVFACHAVFPSMLTVDLLYQIWYNFRTYSLLKAPGELKFIPFEAVNDFLHSDLIREVGAGVYKVDSQLRAQLTQRIEQELGKEQSTFLAHFLKEYSLYNEDTYYQSRIRDLHVDTAEYKLSPNKVIRKYQQVYKDLMEGESNRKIGLVKLKLRLDQFAAEGDPVVQQFDELVDDSLKILDGKNQTGYARLRYIESNEAEGIYVEENKLNQINRLIDKSSQGLTAFPEEVFENTHQVVSLDLSHNRIEQLPARLTELVNLQYLNLDNNPGLNIKEVNWEEMPQLRELKLTRLDLKSVPTGIFSIPHIEKLDLYRNKIKDLPSAIAPFSSRLTHLDLSYNLLPSLPNWLFELENLQKLFVEWNRLEWIPREIEKLDQLRVLHLHANYLSTLPTSLSKLTQLQSNQQNKTWLKGLTIEQNAFRFPLPKEVLELEPRELITYLLDQQQRAADKEGPELYAILVGLNRYEHYNHIAGAENDLEAIQQVVKSSVSPHFTAYQEVRLTNESATRTAVIHELRMLEKKVSTEDMVLFYFSGHSAAEEAPAGWFGPSEEAPCLNGISCYDSARVNDEGNFLLSGIELTYLLSLEAKTVAIFDTHYNGPFSSLDQLSPEMRDKGGLLPARVWSEFLQSEDREIKEPNGLTISSDWPGDMIEIYATSKGETAREYEFPSLGLGSGTRRYGYLTKSLFQILQEAKGEITYADLQLKLLEKSQADFADGLNLQKPIVYLPKSRLQEVHHYFLQAKTVHNFLKAHSYFEQGLQKWRLDIGSLNGMAERDDIRISIPTNQGIIEAEIDQIHSTSTYLRMESPQITQADKLQELPVMNAYVLGIGSEQLTIQVKHDVLRSRLNETRQVKQIHYISAEDAAYEIATREKGNRLGLFDKGLQHQIFEFPEEWPPVDALSSEEAFKINEGIEHIRQFLTIKDLENRESKLVSPVKIILSDVKPLKAPKSIFGSTPTDRLEFTASNLIEFEEDKEMDLTIVNQSDQPLFVLVLSLSSDYSIINLNQDTDRLYQIKPGAVLESGSLYNRIDDYENKWNWKYGLNFVKVIASTESFDPSPFLLDPLKDIYESRRAIRSKAIPDEKADKSTDPRMTVDGDWTTLLFEFRIHNQKVKDEPEKIRAIRNLLAEGSLRKALDSMDNSVKVIQFKRRFDFIQREKRKGFTSDSELQLQENSLIDAVLTYLDDETESLPQTTILFLTAGPSDTVNSRLVKEIREIEEDLRRAEYRDRFKLEQRHVIRPVDLSRVLLDLEPQIVHFFSHEISPGELGTANKEGDKDGIGQIQSTYLDEIGIILEDNQGQGKFVSAEALGGLFELFGAKIKCVFLNGSYSKQQVDGIIAHVPYVVGVHAGIPDATAIAFATAFYNALGDGKDIPFAFKFARNRIMLEGLRGADIPILLQ